MFLARQIARFGLIVTRWGLRYVVQKSRYTNRGFPVFRQPMRLQSFRSYCCGSLHACHGCLIVVSLPFFEDEIAMNKLMLSLLLGSISVFSGCLPSPSANNSSGKPKASTTPGVTAEEATPRETIGKTTQNVMPMQEAVDKGGVLATKEADTSNPLLGSAAAYRNTVATLGAMSVDKAIQLRNAQSVREPKPLTYEVFMDEIIKKGKSGGIRLPMLPYYQEYVWDEQTQKLRVVNFPARKEEREKQR